MNLYLLIAGDNYYPQAGDFDWKRCYPTFEAAHDAVTTIQHKRIITRGKRKGEEEVAHETYSIDGREYDWWDIIDLKEWIEAHHSDPSEEPSETTDC